jgi:EF hand
MTKTSKILTTTSFVALLSAFGLAACGGAEVEPAAEPRTTALGQSATPDAPPPGMAREGHAPHGPRGEHRFGPPSPDKFLERFDGNKNGQLEAAELPPRMQEHIADIDTSGDAIVSKDELGAHFKARAAEWQAKMSERAKQRFEQRDTNHDGVIDQSEAGDRWAHLSPADANGDQKLTFDELKTAFESGKLKPPMGHGRHGGRGMHGGPDQGAPDAPPPPAL